MAVGKQVPAQADAERKAEPGTEREWVTLETVFAKLRGWTLCGTVLNWSFAALCLAAFSALVFAAAVLGEGASSLLGGISSTDPESVVAGYEVLGRLLAGGGIGFLYLVLLVGLLMLLVPLVLSLIPAILGTVWLKTQTAEGAAKGSGRVSIIIRITANGALSAVFLCLLADEPSAAMAAALLLQLFLLCTHIRCLFLAADLRAEELD